MFTKIILEPTIDAAASDAFGLTVEDTALTIFCTGLQGDETAVMQYKDEFTQEWHDVEILLPDGTTRTPTFKVGSNTIFLQDDWGEYRFNKSETADSVGIFIRRFINAGGA